MSGVHDWRKPFYLCFEPCWHRMWVFAAPVGVGVRELAQHLPGRVRGHAVGRAQVPHRRHQLRRPCHGRLGQTPSYDIHRRLLLRGRHTIAFLQVSSTRFMEIDSCHFYSVATELDASNSLSVISAVGTLLFWVDGILLLRKCITTNGIEISYLLHTCRRDKSGG